MVYSWASSPSVTICTYITFLSLTRFVARVSLGNSGRSLMMLAEMPANVGEYTVNSSSFAVGMYRRFGFVETGPLETRNGVRAVPMKSIEAESPSGGSAAEARRYV